MDSKRTEQILRWCLVAWVAMVKLIGAIRGQWPGAPTVAVVEVDR